MSRTPYSYSIKPPTEIVSSLVMLARRRLFLLVRLSPRIEHGLVEVCLRHAALVVARVSTHDVCANDPAQSFVLKPRLQRIQHNVPPPFSVRLLTTINV